MTIATRPNTPEKLPPHDNEAESAVIGSLLVDGEAIRDVLPDLHADHFFSDRERWVYESCMGLYGRAEAISIVTVKAELLRNGKLDAIGGEAYLHHLQAGALDPFLIKGHADIVVRLALMRRLITAGAEITRIGFQADPDVDATVARAENIIKAVSDSRPQSALVLPEQAMTEASRLYEDIEEGRITAVPTPFPTITWSSGGGLYPGELWYLGGRPGAGKTEIALQFARHAAKRSGPVLVVSKEMPRQQLYHRHVMALTGVDLQTLRRGHWTPEQRTQIHEAVASFAMLQITYLARQRGVKIGVPTIRSTAMRMQDRGGLALIVVDYVQILNSEGGDKQRIIERVTQISADLQDMCNELNVPALVVSQLNRSSLGRENQTPDMGDLRESGALEQDADGILLVYRPIDAETKKPSDNAQLIFAKLRQGGGGGQVNLLWRNMQHVEQAGPGTGAPY